MSTKRIKLVIALIVVFAAALLAFAGCKIGQDSAQDILDQNNATARVDYYANGGEFNNKEKVLNVYYKPESRVLNIAQKEYLPTNGSDRYPVKIYIEYNGYILTGWEYAELDKNGNPVFIDTDGSNLYLHVAESGDSELEYPKDGQGNPLKVTAFDNEAGEIVFRDEKLLTVKSSGNPVDFTQRIQDGGRWYFVASWIEDVRLNYVLLCDEEVEISVYKENNELVEVKKYKSGDIIHRASFGNGSSVKVSSYAPATDNATFLQAFSDSECNTEVESVAKPSDGIDATVYVKYIPGKWDIVKTPLEVSNMFANLGIQSKQFYIFNDIDCSNISISPNESDLKCTIVGNGHTLKNLNASKANLGRNANISLFGNITAEAKITDLKIENLNVQLETRNDITATGLFLFCNGIEEGAEISGIELKNASLTFGDAKRQSIVTNIPYADGAYSTVNWMFGGLETDEAFTAEYDVKVNGYTLKVVTDSIKEETEILVSVDPN